MLRGGLYVQLRRMRAILSTLSCAVALLAQVDTGFVSGIVTDPSGAVVPGATISVTRLEINSTFELLTNESGFYSATALRPGRHEISVIKKGFGTQKSQLDVRVQDRAEQNFQLDVKTPAEEIMVTAATPLLESETSSLGHVVEETTVNELPLNGRNFIQLAILGAGTLPWTRSPEQDNFISNGARALENSYLLDGVDNRNWIKVQHKSCHRLSIRSRNSKFRLLRSQPSLDSPPAES